MNITIHLSGGRELVWETGDRDISLVDAEGVHMEGWHVDQVTYVSGDLMRPKPLEALRGILSILEEKEVEW